MHPHRDDIVAAYAAGEDVDAIARLYGVSRADVERIAGGGPPPGGVKGGGLGSAGNRVLLGVGCGFVVQFFAGLFGADLPGRLAVAVVVAAVVYAVGTLISQNWSRVK